MFRPDLCGMSEAPLAVSIAGQVRGRIDAKLPAHRGEYRRRARPGGRTRRRRRLVADTLRGIARQHAAVPEAARPARPPRWTTPPALDLMRAASRPQRRGRGRETPEAAAARGRRDAAIVALAFCAGAAPLRDRRPGLGRHHADGAHRPAAGPRAGLEGQRRRPTRGPPAARRRVRPRRRGPARGDRARRGRPRRAARPAPGQPPPAGPGRRARPRGRVVALRPPGAGLGARPPRRVVARYASAVAVEDGAVARLFGGSG